jgi:hypothetical protein
MTVPWVIPRFNYWYRAICKALKSINSLSMASELIV